MARRWAINGRFLTQPLTGVQRYGREILCALDRLVTQGHAKAQNLEIEVLVPPGYNDCPQLTSIPIRTIGRSRGQIWEQAELVPHVLGGLVSLCNTGPLLVRRHILCVHDLNTRIAPASYSPQFRLLYRGLVPLLGRSAATMTTVSNFSANQLVNFGIRAPGTVTVLPNGHEHALRWKAEHDLPDGKVDSRTILMIGSRAPHKNMGLLLGMAERLKSAGLRLAIVGALDPRIFRSTGPVCEAGHVVWLGRVDDDTLAFYLSQCLCLAFPSLTEGFGLPPLEAMTLGCPVVVSNRASLPEICGTAALYASPDDADQWLAHFIQLNNDEGLRVALRERGRQAAQRFSWVRSAAGYLECMARLDSVALEPFPPQSAKKMRLTTGIQACDTSRTGESRADLRP